MQHPSDFMDVGGINPMTWPWENPIMGMIKFLCIFGNGCELSQI